MAYEPYTVITYEKYRCNRPDESLHTEVENMSSSDKSTLFKEIGLQVCQYTYNKRLNQGTSGNTRYKIYMSFTKHTCCSVSAEVINGKITRMYFSDILIEKNLISGGYTIKEIKSYKINQGNVPNLIYFADKGSTYGLKFTTRTTIPYKLPLIGISNKKVFLSVRSSFIEGPHLDIYEQDYLFSWKTDNDPEREKYENMIRNPSDGYDYIPVT